MTSTFDAEGWPDIDFSQLLNVDSEVISTNQKLTFAVSNDDVQQYRCELHTGDEYVQGLLEEHFPYSDD